MCDMNDLEEKLKIIYRDITEVCIEVAKDAHTFIGSHELKGDFIVSAKYPTLHNQMFYDEKYYEAEKLEEIPYLKYRIPKYEMRGFPGDRQYYTAIFEVYRKEKIDLKEYKKIDEIRDTINSDPEVVKIFTEKEKLYESFIRTLVERIVERYLYMTKASEIIPENIEEEIKPYIIERLWFYFYDTLFFDICVPICLATFEKDIKLDDTVEIVAISEELQKARQVECNYEVAHENWVAACATHMIVLHNCSYTKNSEYSFNSVMRDYSCYPLDKIDEILSVIRVATGYDIGYEQIFCIPDKWVYNTAADLPAICGTKSHFVNPRFMKGHWMQLPVSFVTAEQCDEISCLYKGFKSNENKLRFPLMRLNRCMLRDKMDDMTTDACIGIESLLAGGTKGEITYTISNRIPIVLSKVGNTEYNPQECRKYMKKIYNLRSRIVHGGELKDKDIYLQNGDTKLYIPQIAVDFLRLALEFMIKNPQYLSPDEIDKYLDSIISNF